REWRRVIRTGGPERRADAPDMAARPPTFGRAPAEPWRASGLRQAGSCVRLVSHEHVADATDGLDVAGRFRIGLELRAKIRHVHVDRAVERLVILTLQAVQELLAREHATGRPRERGQQLELVMRERHAAPGDGRLTRVEVD